ncbi:MAG: hypothetical protein K1X57_07695 [Gemmataceae bacterium]|nr:hypothetical protein [Gemmataceae bacterium]
MTPEDSKSQKPKDPEKGKAVPVPTPIPDDGSSPRCVPIPTSMTGEDDDDVVDFSSLSAEDGGSTAMSRSQLSGPLSGTSIVSWADLMKARSDEAGAFDLEGPESIDFDAASDRDILKKALNDEPPSGKLNVSPGEAAPADKKATGKRDTDSILDFLIEDEQASSILTPDRPGDSSRINLLRDVTGKTGSSQKLDKTDQYDSPLIVSPDDDDAAAEIGAIPVGGIESSAVDLGSQSVIDLPFPAVDSKVMGPGSGRRKSRSGSSQGDSGTVDLLGSGKGSGLSTVPGLTAVAGSARRDQDLPATTPVEFQPRGNGWINGVLGGLAGVAVCVGVWMSGALPGSGSKPAPKAAAPTIDLAGSLAFLDSGNLDKAIESLSKLPASPETSASLGQARLLRYLRDCKVQNTAPKVADEAVQLAESDLKAANSAAGALWLGLLKESFGQVDAAKTIYKDALTKYADQAKLFQAALDRLDTRPANAGPRAAIEPLGATLFTLLLQVEPTAKDEAGFEFWKAVRLARSHKYSEAQAALTAARAAHDERRFVLARKGLNPQSDPLEDIFLRCCDELKDYWAIKSQLHTSLDLTKQSSAGAAVSQALTQYKAKAEESKQLSSRLAAIRDALSQSGLDLNDLPAAVNKLVKAKEVADAAVKTAKKSADDSAALAKSVEANLKTAQAQADKAVEAQKALEDELKKTKDLLAAMKSPPINPKDPADVAKIDAERVRLDAKVKELEDQLATVRQQGERAQMTSRELGSLVQSIKQRVQVPPNAAPAEVLTGLDAALAAKPTRADLPPVLPGAYLSDPRSERAFARGLVSYRAGDLTEAEKQFGAALTINGLDARYWYFRGLARAGLGRAKDAEADFQQGLERERRNLPNAGAIDAQLERLNAEDRGLLNRARGRM